MRVEAEYFHPAGHSILLAERLKESKLVILKARIQDPRHFKGCGDGRSSMRRSENSVTISK
jgi:hypothetical protein